MYAQTPITYTMGLDLHHTLQFNLDFGPDAIQTQLLWKLHSLSLLMISVPLYTRRMIFCRVRVYKPSLFANCSQGINKIDFIDVNPALLQVSLFCGVMLCTSVQVHRRFGRIYCLYLQCRRYNKQRTRNKQNGCNFKAYSYCGTRC
jgi:hypothetical protein